MAIPNDPNQNRQKPKKKNGSGLWGLVILALIWLFNRINAGDLSRFFMRLRWALRTGDFRMDGAPVIAIAAIVLIIVLAVTLTRIKKVRAEKRFDGVRARGGGTAAAHSHDRLQGYAGNESSTEHWKKQLDGFLAAGIIDRSEYRVLMERRRR
ncbi:MAG: hypothetical protein IKD61_03985 [Oscillospiraceae bacterium]|nr:hypothetical protein [Oscillospiraceae bacterium]